MVHSPELLASSTGQGRSSWEEARTISLELVLDHEVPSEGSGEQERLREFSQKFEGCADLEAGLQTGCSWCLKPSGVSFRPHPHPEKPPLQDARGHPSLAPCSLWQGLADGKHHQETGEHRICSANSCFYPGSLSGRFPNTHLSLGQ